MTIDRDVEVISARLDEQGRLINQQGERLNIHATRMDGLILVVFGDDEKGVRGLIDRTGELEKLTSEIQQWRRDMMIYARVGIVILGVSGLGTWLPYIREFLKFIGG